MEAEGDASFLKSSESGEETQDSQSSNNNATCTPVSEAFELDQESGDLSGDSEISLREEGLLPPPKKAKTKRRSEGSKGANSSINEDEKEEIINKMMRRFQEQFVTKGQLPLAQVASTQRSPRDAGMNQPGTSVQRDRTTEVSWGDNSEQRASKPKGQNLNDNPCLWGAIQADSEITIYQNAVQIPDNK